MHSALFMVAVALLSGMVAQSLGRASGIPGIALLLATGVLLGPDFANIVQPSHLGAALPALTDLAVSVVLFEGGLALNLASLRRQAKSIRRLVSLGAVITTVGGCLAARLLLHWPWQVCWLFGTLVIVTGPTVVQPIVRRIRLSPGLSTVLEAEGVFGDAIGAIIAVVALEVVVNAQKNALAFGAWGLGSRLGLGVLIGVAGGLLVVLLLRSQRLVSEGLENVFALSLVIALYELSNAMVPESGILCVSLAGLTAGNMKPRGLDSLRDFKEQLTVMLIGLLFVLLAADVRLEAVIALGLQGLGVVFLLMFVVRPINVGLSTYACGLTLREKLFVGWMGPRGIVAAAVASVFAKALGQTSGGSGDELRAMVFLVIATTVVIQGMTAKTLAGLLKLRQPPEGYLIAGANGISQALGALLQDSGQSVDVVDSNLDAVRALRARGIRTHHGNALESDFLHEIGMDAKRYCIAVTSNEATNLVLARKALHEFKVERSWVALRRGHKSISAEDVQKIGAHVLFSEPRYLEFWNLEFEREFATIEWWELVRRSEFSGDEMFAESLDLFLPLVSRWKSEVVPVLSGASQKKGCALAIGLAHGQEDVARNWLVEHGWRQLSHGSPREESQVS